MKQETSQNKDKPDYVLKLEAVYGQPSQAGFGSAVFFRQLEWDTDLQETAKEIYQTFIGPKWTEWGPETWLNPWQEIYARQTETDRDIVQELKQIDNRSAAYSVEMILDIVETPDAARQALSSVYDAPTVSDLRVFQIGDGEAMSGILIAGRRDNDDTTFLLFLMD